MILPTKWPLDLQKKYFSCIHFLEKWFQVYYQNMQETIVIWHSASRHSMKWKCVITWFCNFEYIIYWPSVCLSISSDYISFSNNKQTPIFGQNKLPARRGRRYYKGKCTPRIRHAPGRAIQCTKQIQYRSLDLKRDWSFFFVDFLRFYFYYYFFLSTVDGKRPNNRSGGVRKASK